MHRRILVSAAIFVFVVVGLASFFSVRITIQQEQGTLLDLLKNVVRYASSAGVPEEQLSLIAGSTHSRIIRMNSESGAIVYDSSGETGYYLDQPDVRAALRSGYGEEVSFYDGISNMQVAVTIRESSSELLRITKRLPVFKFGGWPLFTVLMAVLLLTGLYFAVETDRRIVKPIETISSAAQDIVEGRNVDLENPEMLTYTELNVLLSTLRSMNSHLQVTLEQLQQKSTEVESIIEHMRNGLIAVDSQLRVVQMNNAARHMLGVLGDVQGKYVLEATGNSKLENGLKEVVEHEELYTIELPVRVSSQQHIIRLYVSPMESGTEEQGAVALLEDVTELRNLEQMRTDFAANVTHELKTPLTSIQGFVETLKAGAIEEPEMARHFLDIIEKETERLSRLINDVLSLSSMENGRVRVPTERIDIGKQAEDVCLMLQKTAQDKNITLTCEKGEDGFILANQDHVRQLLINLTDNAIKYTLEGGNVNVRVHREEDKVFFRVKDTGIGIAQEHIPRLFERFYRVDKGRSRNMGGTGLGLAIVKHIVMEMDGQIDVQSELGVGTEFVVTLPFARES